MEPIDLLPEFDHEVVNTRKMLQALDEEHLEHRPHPKSWTTRELATHVANVLSWTRPTFELDGLDLSGSRPLMDKKSASQILELFEDNAKDAREAIGETTAETLRGTWSLKSGDEVHFSMPKLAVYRFFVINHLIHHRGQLAVHLRASGLEVPGMYGPSADESF